MIAKQGAGSFIYKAMFMLALCATLLLPQQIEARVLAGSVTERKINRKIASLLKAARKNYDKGKVQVALDNYWKILEIDPQETFAYLELGEIYVELRIYDRAIELLEPGLTMAQREMDSDTVCYYYCILTNAHLALNQTGHATKTLIKAAEAAPKNPMPRKILGDIYLANNRIADAIKAYKKALEFDPDYQPARIQLGEVIAQHGERPQKPAIDRQALARKAEPLPATKPATKPAAATPDRPRPKPATEPAPISAPAPATQADTINEDGFEEISSADNMVIPDETALLPMPAATPKPAPIAANVEARPMPVSSPPAKTDTAPVTNTASATQPATRTPSKASPEEIEAQIDKLLAGNLEEKKAAASFFVKLEEKGLVEIEELIYDPDPEVRILAVRTLLEFKAFKSQVKTILEDASDDPDPSVIEEINKAFTLLN